MWLLLTFVVFFSVRWFTSKVNSPLANPLLLSIIIIIPALMALDVPYKIYYAQNDWMTYLLQPAVVALAYPLYEQLPQIRQNWKIILLACGVGSCMSMLSAGLISVSLHTDPTLVASLMGKSVTTPIAMEIAKSLGGEPAIAAILVLIVGVFGSVFAYPIYTFLGVTHPIARGLTMGTVSHALGTATCAAKNSEDAAFSSLALVCCGIITSILAPLFFTFCLWVGGFIG
ncbi:LrgB family protein [Vibrio hibernica]|uniref:LrgB family protein n=1 Tax=Vibrio hibernica TaxID=2587465 RepID=UPI001882C066|nr:LrgB family protein [Vibrio hibernica]